MLSIRTNQASLAAGNSIERTQQRLATSMTRLSTGYRINSAMDDAAGLQIATRLKSQTSGMAVAMRNTQNSISMLQTAEGALDEVSNMLIRMNDLAIQAADASSTKDDKIALQAEYDALGLQSIKVIDDTTFGGARLFAPLVSPPGILGAPMTFQIGESASETMTVNLQGDAAAMNVAMLYTNTQWTMSPFPPPGTELTSPASTATAMGWLDQSLKLVGKLRSDVGAVANRLEHVYNNLANISTNTKAATGRIMDVDFATESSEMTSNQMLLQAGTAMLKQTNSMSSMVMSLIQQ
jgi:flagellin